ncbi:Uncharacterized protein HZ326_4337 [Fusarium oxysporum f. sp. albedinis]|nr:Uncharacterized protein HZ326_4337 [Fusarium oxysporum f. sp. albedinis]
MLALALLDKKRSDIFLGAGTGRRRGPNMASGSTVEAQSGSGNLNLVLANVLDIVHLETLVLICTVCYVVSSHLLTTYKALTPPAPELIVSALQHDWLVSSLSDLSQCAKFIPCSFLRVAAERQVLCTLFGCLLE